MNIENKHYRTIWESPEDSYIIQIIDQRYLPHKFIIEELNSVEEVVTAIRDMHVRGAGLIGATAAYGMYLATLNAQCAINFEDQITEAANAIKSTRPTAVNLEWAVNRQLNEIKKHRKTSTKIAASLRMARIIADEDANNCRQIGEHGVKLIEKISQEKPGQTVNILTHCNAGWLAFVDYGSATAPIYAAFDKGIDVHVWVDETRPRNQGAGLTAWELGKHGVPHTVIADNTGGHLMQHKMVDMVIVGTDRTTAHGDVANKIGTYLKALAANDNHIPFYVAVPSSSIDWNISDGLSQIPIEKRDENEVKYITGLHNDELTEVLLTPAGSKAANYGFDVTPARLISGLITERGICKAKQADLASLFPDKTQHNG